ncbi:MAG: hypothetical protein RL189_782 [Pseudomonadota bacterium]|jgi:hypothetical protein
MRCAIAILFFAWFVLGCKAINESSDSIHDAKQLLNQGEYEKVIGLLSQDAQKIDVSSEHRILLASAYAGSIGLNLVDSYPAFEELLFKDALIKRSSATENPLTGQSEDTVIDQQKAEQELLNMIASIVKASKVVFGLRWIPPAKRPRVFKAAQQLDRIAKTDHLFKSASVYKLIIFSSLFMSTFRDSLVSQEKQFELPTEFFCDLNIYKFVENLARMQAQLRIIEAISKDVIESSLNPPASLQKIITLFERIRIFFTKNRDHITLAGFLHGALRNEICK